MPPKKGAKSAGNKSALKAKQKQAEDKTFGLKNKNKSSKVQKYVQQVQQQAVQAHKQTGPQISKKEREKALQNELGDLFKPVAVKKIAQPKKIDLYTDVRQDITKEGGMEDWDQDKLEEVVLKKHGKQPPTEIVCKYFIQAVEDKKYGWFWQCPNGDECKYRHALPPGFVLKSDRKKKDAEDIKTLEEWIEEQRSNLPKSLTPVTLESFNEWKTKRKEKEAKEENEKLKSREAAVKAGKSIGASGRDLFTFNPEMFAFEDDDEIMDFDYSMLRKGGDENEPHNEEVAEMMEGVSLTDLQQ